MVGTRLAAVLLLVAAPAVCQSVRGQLTDSITKAPLPGAFLTLVDNQGFELTRTMTNSAGEFLLTAPAPGSYRLRSKRIGFRPYLSVPLELRAGTPLAFNVAIDPIPVALSSVVIEGEQQCDVAAGGGSVSAVWEEVREALAAVAWTARLPNYWYDISHFQRDVSASGRRQAGRPDSTWREIGYQRVPIKSVPAEDLEVNGFVLLESDTTYRGPDAEVLMSGPFLRTHCFATRTGKDETEGLIGLAFSPVRGRRLSDIQGTLWIDKTSAELRELNYTYTHLPDDFSAPRAGGHIEFVRLPSGTWIVSNWVIRMPLLMMHQRAMAMGTELRVIGYRETGADLVEIKTRSGAIVYRGDSLAVALATLTAGPSSAAQGSVEPIPSLPTAPANADQPAVAAPAPAARATARHSSSDVIAQDEVESSSATDAYALIQELRPMWLHSRGQISIHDPGAGTVQVYLHGERFGDVSRLREISKPEIREIRFYGAAQAEMRFGAGNAGGVIDLQLGVTTPVRAVATNPPPPPPAPTDTAPPSAPAPAPPPPPAARKSPAEAAADSISRIPQANRRRLAGNQNVLTPEEYAGTGDVDVLTLIEHYRSSWLLRDRGPVSIYNRSAGDIQVYLNGVALVGGLSRLRDFRAADMRELRFLSAGEAQQRYGTNNAGGGIEVWTR